MFERVSVLANQIIRKDYQEIHKFKLILKHIGQIMYCNKKNTMTCLITKGVSELEIWQIYALLSGILQRLSGDMTIR